MKDMKKLKRTLVISLVLFISICFSITKVLAKSNELTVNEIDFTQEFKDYMKLSDEEKQKAIMPRP